METAIKVKKCYLCGHIGEDVTRIMYRHVGGEGAVTVPMCADKQACFKRVDAADKEWRQAMGRKQ